MRFDLDIFRRIRGLCHRQPALPAALVLLAAALFALSAVRDANRASATAARRQVNLAGTRSVAEALDRVVPRHMPPGGPDLLTRRIEQSLVAAGTPAECAISSLAIQSLGGVGGLPTSRHQAHIELKALTLAQVAVALDAVESSGLPAWIDSLEVWAAPAGSDQERWNAVLQVDWLATPKGARRE